MSLYKAADPEHLQLALDSLLNQKIRANEIVIVLDGPVSEELNGILQDFKVQAYTQFKISTKLIPLSINRGLGLALKEGLKHCSNEWIARMDADDICKPERFKLQLEYIQSNRVDVLGTAMEEFINIPGDYGKYKVQPQINAKILRKSIYLNPVSHPSVFFRKSAVLNSGSYLDMPLFEDFYLWIRMIKKGYHFANLPEPLLYFRIGNDMIGRRHGWSYLKKEWQFIGLLFSSNISILPNF